MWPQAHLLRYATRGFRRWLSHVPAPPEQSRRSVLPPLGAYRSYEELCRQFRWQVPERFNIGYECSDYWLHGGFGNKIALVEHASQARYSFSDLAHLSANLSQNFRDFACASGHPLEPGDRVAVLLSQSVTTAIAHLSIFKLGCISVPLFTLFGSDALDFRLNDSGAKALITEASCLNSVLELAEAGRLPHLKYLLITGAAAVPAVPMSLQGLQLLPLEDFLAQKRNLEVVETRAEDPALLIYTSGTTGNPKGCLHAHRVLLGHLPGIELPHKRFVQTRGEVVFWTPADWAWIGGLFDVLFPALYYGVTTVSHRMQKFSVQESYEVMRRNQVTNAFLPPTAIKMMKGAEKDLPVEPIHEMHSIGSGGETVGPLLDFGHAAFRTEIHEFYGQTECNLLVSNCDLFPLREGSMGKAVCGKSISILDEATGRELGENEPGVLAVLATPDAPGGCDPAQFLGYWKQPEKTQEKFVVSPLSGLRYMITGDLARQVDGYLWFVGRDDDVINTGGYRCGPGEIEEECMKHPQVLLAAAIGKPCKLRSQIIKVFLVLRDPRLLEDSGQCEQIASEVQELVKTRLGRHEYPREVEFVEKLHMTITGKVQRKKHRMEEMAKASAE